MLKREWGAESNGKLPHLFIRSKTATLLPGFEVEDLTLDRTATLVPAFAVKDLPFVALVCHPSPELLVTRHFDEHVVIISFM